MLSKIPSVNIILEHLSTAYPHIHPDYLKRFIRQKVRQVHENPKKFGLDERDKAAFEAHFTKQLIQAFASLLSGSLTSVINATGIVLHTNLGRAPLNPGIIEKLHTVGRYTNLELNLTSGRRGQRSEHLSELLQLLSGSEDGLAVNNNAAAVMLMLNSVGYRKEVILSRGEMIEIGGSFRLPEVMKMSGCKLKEVGTTNKTHLSDYEQAITKKTGAILICHTSNYEVQGFTSKPELDDLVCLAQKNNIPLIYDLGSGLFEPFDFDKENPELMVSEIVATGVDLVSFSGDKLLGGPQAGLIVGKRSWIERCAKNHLLRALRLDKLMISALQETLLQHLSKETGLESIRALNLSAETLKERSEQFIKNMPVEIQSHLKAIPEVGQVGSGAYPTFELPSYAIQINTKKKKASRIASQLRHNNPPVLGYIDKDIFHLDLRAVSQDEEEKLRQAIIVLFLNTK